MNELKKMAREMETSDLLELIADCRFNESSPEVHHAAAAELRDRGVETS